MADKRISQLVDRGTVANNDVVPIVVSGASTTNKATISSIQTFMQGNLDMGVTSVGLSMPSAFVVSNSPVTASGNISVTGAGTVSQYIRGDGSLADFPSGGGGGGSSVNYYLNGSVSQGTIGGIAYKEMNRVPVLGAGTDFVAIADGYLASFITDAGDPALLEIPAGNWNFETYFSASSGGGTPSFYVELYKVDSGGTATLIASNSATPELIAFGTTITPYFSTLAVPTTSLAITDRLALRYYVARSGRTITLHTENSHLCQIITTFTTGLTALNGLTAQVQNFATGTSGTDFNISSSVSTHTFNLPDASASARGVVTTGSQTFAGAKTFNSSVTASSLIRTGGTSSQFLKADGSVDSSTYLTTGSAGSTYVPYSGASANVDLGVYNLTASEIIANGSGSNSGIIHLESNAFHSLVNGYGSISSGTTNQFNLYQTTGAGVFRCAILSLNSITASATRTYTLPDADGTLALTSSLSGYLPLAGGTLTGALNGTSASFSGGVTINGLTFVNNTSDTTARLLLRNTTTGADAGGLDIREIGVDASINNASNGSLSLSTNNTPRLTISSTGAATFSSSVSSVGLSVTGSNGAIAGTGLAYINNSDDAFALVLNNNGLTNQNDRGVFEVRRQSNSIFRVNNSGNVGIGTASPAQKLVVEGSEAIVSIVDNRSYATGVGGALYLYGNYRSVGDVTVAGYIKGSKVNSTDGDYGFNLIFGTQTYTGGVSEKMRITSTGNVGIGTASPTARLQVRGANEISTFFDAQNEGASGATFSRIGNSYPFNRFLFQNGYIDVLGSYMTYPVSIEAQSGGGQLALTRGGAVAEFYMGGTTSGGTVLYVRSGGSGGVYLAAGSTGWVANSDERLKTDLLPIENGLEKVASLRSVIGRYLTDDEDKKRAFLIAQDVEKVLPEAVVTIEETGDMGVNYTEVIPLLVAAIKELKTEIDSLKNQMQ